MGNVIIMKETIEMLQSKNKDENLNSMTKGKKVEFKIDYAVIRDIE